MKCLRLCVLLSLVMTLYGVRRFLDEAEVAQAVAFLECLVTQRQWLNDLMCQEVLLLGCGDVTRGRASTLDDRGKVVNV